MGLGLRKRRTAPCQGELRNFAALLVESLERWMLELPWCAGRVRPLMTGFV